MVHKPPTQTGSEHDDAAFIDAYERRKAGGRPTDVPAEWRAEVEDFVRIHQRLAAEPMPDVSPAVRSIILSAAAEATREPMQQPLFTRLLHLIMRPGPVLAMMTVAALAVAVGVRLDKAAAPPELPIGAVASHVVEPSMQAPPGDRVVTAEADRGAAPTTLDRVEEPAAQVEVPSAAPSATPPKPTRVIAARPASLGPEPKAAELARQEAKPSPPEAPSKAKTQDLAEALDADASPQVANGAVAAKSANRAAGGSAGLGAELKLDKAPAEQQVQKYAKAEASSERAADDRESAPAAEEKPQQVDSSKKSVAKDAPSAPAARSAPAPSAAVQSDAQRDVVELKAKADKTSDPEVRVALLQKLLATAKKLGDAKTEKWAREQLQAAEQVVTRNRANVQQQRAAPSQQNQAPLQKEKAGKSL